MSTDAPTEGAGIPPPTEITIRGVSKWFADKQVLKGVSTEVSKGEALAVIGPSGSGKTTLLRCVNLLEEFQEGEIRIGGQAMGYAVDAAGRRVRRSETEIARMRTQVGMVFQGLNLFPHMTALKNVALGPVRVLGTPRKEAEELAAAMLARVGLADKTHALPGRLSGGQQQRVAIARALAMQPKAMLFDEVTSALDPELVGEVLDVMRQLVQEGMTMIIVTHEMAFARAFAHRILFMAEGEIVEQGEPAHLFDHPDSPRLQAFLRRFKQGYQL